MGIIPIKLIIIIVLMIGIVGGALALTKAMKKGNHVKKPVVLTTMKLEEFVVNLADSGESRYLRVNLTLEIESPADKSKASEGGGHGGGEKPTDDPKIRDAIITVLTKKHYAELLKEKGQAQLKEDLKVELDKVLKETEKDSKVAGIYFTSFVMQ
jgi:flagellar basal body-associated protein FliL